MNIIRDAFSDYQDSTITGSEYLAILKYYNKYHPDPVWYNYLLPAED